MPKLKRFINGRVFRDTGFIKEELWVDSESGKIINAPSKDADLSDVQTIDVDGKIICPGFIDVQINGAFGFDFSGLDANMSISEFEKGLHDTNQRLIETGTTSYLPTMTSQFEATYHKILPSLRATGSSRDPTLGAESLGAHIEGPFFPHTQKGCHSPEAILSIGNTSPPELLHKVYGEENLALYVKMVTLAPERVGALDSIRELSARGIIPSIGHTAATYEEAMLRVKAGSRMITHLFNAMNQLHHREPGIFGLIASPADDQTFRDREDLTDDGRPYFGLIADGIHIHPASVRLAWETHPKGLILITDAVMLMGCEDGIHDWTNRQKIVKKQSLLKLHGLDTIAGSATPILDCLNNLMCWAGASVHQAIQTITTNPAALLHLEDTKGTLAANADADIVILRDVSIDKDCSKLEIDEVWKFGHQVFNAWAFTLLNSFMRMNSAQKPDY